MANLQAWCKQKYGAAYSVPKAQGNISADGQNVDALDSTAWFTFT